jgi:hypothetical protein
MIKVESNGWDKNYRGKSSEKGGEDRNKLKVKELKGKR